MYNSDTKVLRSDYGKLRQQHSIEVVEIAQKTELNKMTINGLRLQVFVTQQNIHQPKYTSHISPIPIYHTESCFHTSWNTKYIFTRRNSFSQCLKRINQTFYTNEYMQLNRERLKLHKMIFHLPFLSKNVHVLKIIKLHGKDCSNFKGFCVAAVSHLMRQVDHYPL